MSEQMRSRVRWSRRYPPLASALVALLLAMFVLPSALNIPQSNPTQTLEFAPIPPEDDQPPPPPGNVESLSLGSSATSPSADAEGGSGPGLPPPAIPEGVGEAPITKRCVGNPPKQTEDPLAPPCVGHFDGDNGGATTAGVTADEIRVLVYQASNVQDGVTARGAEQRPAGECFDLGQPPSQDEHFTVRSFRVLQGYFNDRFQTYNRFVHFYVCFDAHTGSTTGCLSAEDRVADARNLYDLYEPFAVLPYPDCTGVEFVEQMAGQSALNFGMTGARPADFFRAYPGYIWGYTPSLEEQAAIFSSHVCQKVVPNPVESSGNGDAGQPRKFGMLIPEEPDTTIDFAGEVRRRIEDCGATIEVVGRYPAGQTTYGTGNDAAAAQNMAAFQQAGVTTVIWPKGHETKHSGAAARLGYLPEWLLAGDLQHEGRTTTAAQDQTAFDGHAFVVTTLPLNLPGQTSPCAQAVDDYAPDWPQLDQDYLCGLRPFFYTDTFQLFLGIQVAGPRLTAESLDRGMHAIPAIPSSAPNVPACFYNPGDYTCIKDAAVGWWDADGGTQTGDGGTPGCWRMMQGGLRHFAGQWPEGNIQAQKDDASDPCHDHGGGFQTYA